ncbi:DUF934 domain-containing protein [Denitrobaculum tricleocarpae]|uniref:DUF934 domain-containing protein n=1 Tax=Denitrobaculum tricleocarpae TaxID=2591009 RepID=A0A545TXI0_9PROT|nr:DUF934 domain-containing protein [Denitrobaculum tricleocarpae]TQV81938.1 DUF934 domain-containing protein [Denitrobaculum tricleocarpae]
MPLIKEGVLAEDSWQSLADEDELREGPIVVTLERWQSERDSLLARNTPLGVRLRSDQSPALVAEDLERFGLVALEFPKFNDGRAYSYARLLRDRYGFKGEVRAVGGVFRDQFLLMQRCGFDAFEVADKAAVEAWEKAISEISVTYQPGADARRPALALRRNRPAA